MSDHSVFNFKTKLSADEAIAIAAAMRDVAQADGVHPTEEEMIADFVSGVGADLGEDLKLPKMSPQILAEHLGDPEVRVLALQSLVLLAMADGRVSPEEAALTQKYANALGLGASYPGLESSMVAWVKGGDTATLFA